MRNNIIAIVIFFGFIATVFGIGYAVSRDTMPMHQGRVPNISTAGSQSIDRNGVKDALALQQVSTEPISHAVNGRVANGRVASGEWISGEGSASGGLRSSSSQQLKSYGGGGTSGGSSGSSGGSSKTGNGSVGCSFGGGIGTIAFNCRDSRNSGKMADSPSELVLLDAGVYKNPRLDGFNDDEEPEPGEGDRPGPYENPIGDIPWLVIALLAVVRFGIRKRKYKITKVSHM